MTVWNRFFAAALFASLAPFAVAHAWGVGPEECKHDECNGGKIPQEILDTQPKYMKSHEAKADCPSGTDKFESACYKPCPGGLHHTAACTCSAGGGPITDCKKYSKLEGNHSCPEGYHKSAICTCQPELETNCGRFGMASAIHLVCPEGTEEYGGLCYDKCPEGSTRTAVSTCAHHIRWRGNTHLFVVNRALDLLAHSKDAASQGIAKLLDRPSCRTQWESGLWDTDVDDRSEPKSPGSHFYDGTGKDYDGHDTRVVTWVLAGDEQKKHGNGRTNAQEWIGKVGNLSTDEQCYALGVAIHYVTDATQPMHTSGFSAFQIPLNLHSAYEFYVAMLQSSSGIDGLSFEPSSSIVPQGDPDAVFAAVAKMSNEKAPELMAQLAPHGAKTICSMTPEVGISYTGYCFVQEPGVDELSRTLLRAAHQETAAYLYAALHGIVH